MADKNIFNDKDTIDINELASLNEDISPELIEQLQQKLSKDALSLSEKDKDKINEDFDEKDDATLFEETNSNSNNVNEEPSTEQKDATLHENVVHKKDIDLDKNFDDNFIKKYKAKLNKQKEAGEGNKKSETESTISNAAFSENTSEDTTENIEQLTKGNISERKFTPEQKSYNDSLDLLDGNVKYSKYVIYIDPQNVDFINSLTVKERKNLINKILREQDDIAITKHRFKVINSVIKHVVVAVLTVTISIPVIYWTINASLEATINNYRRSQSIFQTLYKENGKITNLR